MDPRVIVRFFNEYGEIEGVEEFSALTMSAARANATKWLKRNASTNELILEKDNITPNYVKWNLIPRVADRREIA